MNTEASLRLDGAAGEGGGQILRSALALSMAIGRPFVLERIRARRSRPGLLRQHLTALRAATELCAARVEGASLGSSALAFTPGPVRPGHYHFAVGTAGSATLVAQTVLPALMTAAAPSVVEIEGGTHNPMAPPWDFLAETYLPALARLGPRCTTRLERHGFFPAGGGRMVVEVEPVERLASDFHLDELPAPWQGSGRILVASLASHVGRREAKTLQAKLGWPAERFAVESVASDGPGNIILLRFASGDLTEIVAVCGERGTAAEQVALRAVRAARQLLASQAPIGEHLADQLLVPLALAGGGSFRAAAFSSHARTQAALVELFLPVTVQVVGDGTSYRVTVARRDGWAV